MEKVPWNKGMKGHYGHAILIYGYDLNKKTLTVWDPWKASGGTHTLSAAALNKTMQEYGLSYVSAHSDVDLTNAGDLSGDGLDDMIAVDRQDGALYRYTNNGKGKFNGGSSAVKLSTGWNGMTEIAPVGDLTGDGSRMWSRSRSRPASCSCSRARRCPARPGSWSAPAAGTGCAT